MSNGEAYQEDSSSRLRAELRDLFQHLSSLSPAQRAESLREIQQDDSGLYQQLLHLLSVDEAGASDSFATPVEKSFSRDSSDHTPEEGESQSAAGKDPSLNYNWEMETVAYSGGYAEGRYELTERLGRGGFAEVWKAYDHSLERFVAMKIPRHDKMFSRKLFEMFQSEAQKMAQLEVTGIVKVFDIGCCEGKPFVVSELKEGGSLQERIARGPVSLSETVSMIIKISRALHEAHKAGLVHRDIKPANILLDTQNEPCLTDFGLAVTEEEQLIEIPSVLGTTAYMSPEQIQGLSHWANPQSDIYSIGVMFYQLLTGRMPHVARNSIDYREQVLQRTPRAPRLINDSIPPEVERICLKCLAKSPEDRYATAADLAKDLEGCQSDDSEKTLVRFLSPAALVLFLAATTAAVWYSRGPSDKNPPATDPPVITNTTNTVGNGQHSGNGNGGTPEKRQVVPEPNPGEPANPQVEQVPEEPQLVVNGLTIEAFDWPGRPAEEEEVWDVMLKHPEKPIVMSSPKMSLLKLGEVTQAQVREGVRLDVRIRKLGWGGSTGLFYGYQEAEVEGHRQARFQLLQIYKGRAEQGTVLHVSRSLFQLGPEPGESTLIIKSRTKAMKIDTRDVHLRITLKDHELTEAFLNNHSLDEITSLQHNPGYLLEDFPGNWGLYNEFDTSWFIDPKITNLAAEE